MKDPKDKTENTHLNTPDEKDLGAELENDPLSESDYDDTEKQEQSNEDMGNDKPVLEDEDAENDLNKDGENKYF